MHLHHYCLLFGDGGPILGLAKNGQLALHALLVHDSDLDQAHNSSSLSCDLRHLHIHCVCSKIQGRNLHAVFPSAVEWIIVALFALVLLTLDLASSIVADIYGRPVTINVVLSTRVYTS